LGGLKWQEVPVRGTWREHLQGCSEGQRPRTAVRKRLEPSGQQAFIRNAAVNTKKYRKYIYIENDTAAIQ
jgi:hypothetical protein